MTQDIRFQRHELEWTPEKIARFWDYESQNAAKKSEYFTFQLGDALVRLARMNGALAEPVLDYGAGMGYLTEQLVAQGVRCAACDFSPASVESIRRRLGGNPALLKCELLETLPSSLSADAYGTVFMVETLEHLLPEWKKNTLREVGRVLRPGGHVIVTVPHAEPLDLAKVMCADCGAVFHRVQHVAAFDATSLAATLADHGFSTVLCQPMNLGMLTDALVRQNRRIQTRIRRGLTRLKLLAPHPASTPHLVYIGRKN